MQEVVVVVVVEGLPTGSTSRSKGLLLVNFLSIEFPYDSNRHIRP